MFYALIMIGCGVSPNQESTDLHNEINEVQFLVNGEQGDRNNDICYQGNITVVVSPHQGDGNVRIDHQGDGNLVDGEHQGDGNVRIDHQGDGNLVDGEHQGDGNMHLQYVNLSARVTKQVDAIVVNEATSVSFTQDTQGIVETEFCVEGDDFTLKIYAGEQSMSLDVRDYQS